jgi:hypothetical protein
LKFVADGLSTAFKQNLFFIRPSNQTNENLLIFAPASASKTNGVRCLEAVLRINDKIELLKIRSKEK